MRSISWALMSIGRCWTLKLCCKSSGWRSGWSRRPGGSFVAECIEKRSLKDHAKQREWRDMDTMQFETVIWGIVPRTDCPE